jgi:hypothetical protein
VIRSTTPCSSRRGPVRSQPCHKYRWWAVSTDPAVSGDGRCLRRAPPPPTRGGDRAAIAGLSRTRPRALAGTRHPGCS